MPRTSEINRKTKADSFWQPTWSPDFESLLEYVAANHNDGKKQLEFERGTDWETDYVIEPRPGSKSVTPIGVKVARSLQKLLEANGYSVSERTTACNNDLAVIVAAKAKETTPTAVKA